jgi:hypothetical protein
MMLKPNRPFQLHSGKARVITNSQPSHDHFLALNLYLNSRKLTIKSHQGSAPKRDKTVDTKEFEFTTLFLGTGDLNDHSRWQSEKGIKIKLLLDGTKTRQLFLEFDRYRLECPLSSLQHCEILQNSSVLFRFRLSCPPLCSRNSLHGNLDGILFGGIHLDGNFWDSFCKTEAKWERTISPYNSNSFGAYVDYNLVADPNMNVALFKKVLDNFSLKTTITNTPFPQILICKPVDNSQWSNGFDICFSKLSFSFRYLLHTVIASHKLWFRTEEDPKTISNLLSKPVNIPQSEIYILQLFYSPVKESPSSWLIQNLSKLEKKWESSKNDDEMNSIVLIRRVLITPLRICPQPGEADSSNRILRVFNSKNYQDRFLRVSFVDENFGAINQTGGATDIFDKRIAHVVKTLVNIGGERFVFLAYSNSQLREQSAWYYNEDGAKTAAEIRDSIGDFSDINVPGKYGARLGQAFSSTKSTITLDSMQVVPIPDIVRNGYCFSDGIGTISSDVAKLVQKQLNMITVPSAIQIRYQGSKGVLSVWGKNDIAIRPSMVKFKGNPIHQNLEVCNVSKHIPFYLNRQIISILTYLGVSESYIFGLAQDLVCSLDNSLRDDAVALQLLAENANGSLAHRMKKLGIKVKKDRFLREMLITLRTRLLLDLQAKSRILVSKAVNLIGVFDESNTLESDSIYFRSSVHGRFKDGLKVVVGRCPSLHPGDLRVLNVFNVPALEHLVDVVVFSSRGNRPQPNMMSGGDLDGDIFFIIWDPELIPKEEYPPAKYSPDIPVTQNVPVTISHIQGRFT